MLDLLRKPCPPLHLAAVSLAAAVAVALYCFGYSALAGRPESLAESFGWSIINVLPWFPALEGTKRARSLVTLALALLGGLIASLAFGFAFAGPGIDVGFELWRRAPILTLVAGFALGLRWSNHNRQRLQQASDLPLLPRQIDWVRAAGNYVELRGYGRTIVHRASLSSLEVQLRSAGFVRIHRSLLVRRECIVRIRPQDVVLNDGTHLKVGKRYRTQLAA